MRSLTRYLAIFLIISAGAVLSGCGPKYRGWGVLYLDDTEKDLKAGIVLPVLQESEIRDVYTVESGENAAGLDIERWKMAFFEKKADADAFANEYGQWADLYAITLLNGLSIREQADESSARVYKLREGQEVKIIGRAAEKVTIANHDGYWYTVLTEDGSKGYCFDKNLRIYDSKDSGALRESVLDTELLHQFLDKPFRPAYFLDMIRDNMIDLTLFKTTRGIFAYPDENRIFLATRDHQENFVYTGISQAGNGRFIFEGTSLQIEVRSANRIAAYYNINNKEYAELMVYIENMEELIDSEIERRDLIFQQFSDLGTVSSSAYGRISFNGEKGYIWSDFKRLVPAVIPESAQGSGRISLGYFPAPALRNDYDGVVSFSFDGVPGNGLVNFLFKLSDLGVKLVYVPKKDIDNGVVKQESASPLVIFMSGAGE